ncbi:MAG: hypothetical protein CL395_04270 [Acidiferrobacteraceae bacterium]|nr:hypothetical protein [Acidiferrobacteraceae bacterium]
MSSLAGMGHLSLDQAPPLAIPAIFFVTAPVAVMAAGLLLLWSGTFALQLYWLPSVVGLTHLGTLGFLTMTMMGALYQMAPVVAGAPVPFIRLAHLVYLLFCLGVACLSLSLMGLWPGLIFQSFTLISAAILLFLATTGVAIVKSKTQGETVAGMRLALFSLLMLVLLGLTMAGGFVDNSFLGFRQFWLQIHISTALMGWVGGLITAVSWQIIPMFYLTPQFTAVGKKVVLGLTTAGIILPLAVLMASAVAPPNTGGWSPTMLAILGALPAALGVWLVHPYLILRNLNRRRRKRLDPSLRFWQLGLTLAPLTGALAVITCFTEDPRATLLFGWVAIWGWAGIIVHGMLSRIVPFLIWFHRFAPHIGRMPVPAMRNLLPDAWVKFGLGLHVSSLVLGAVAIAMRDPGVSRVTGFLVFSTGLSLLHWIVHLLRQKPDLEVVDEGFSTDEQGLGRSG